MATTSTAATSSNMLSLPTDTADNTAPVRPKFNSHNTQDRLREGAGLYPLLFRTDSNLQKGRRSVFKEMGLDDDSEFDNTSLYSATTSSSAGGLQPYISVSDHSQAESSTGGMQSSV